MFPLCYPCMWWLLARLSAPSFAAWMREAKESGSTSMELGAKWGAHSLTRCVCLPVQWLAQRYEELHQDIIWLKERLMQTDAQLATILGQQQLSEEEEERRKLKRSNSYFGVFGLSR